MKNLGFCNNAKGFFGKMKIRISWPGLGADKLTTVICAQCSLSLIVVSP